MKPIEEFQEAMKYLVSGAGLLKIQSSPQTQYQAKNNKHFYSLEIFVIIKTPSMKCVF